jgi:hypothetical protein
MKFIVHRAWNIGEDQVPFLQIERRRELIGSMVCFRVKDMVMSQRAIVCLAVLNVA